MLPRWRSNLGQHLYDHHLTDLACRTKARVHAREPHKSLEVGLWWFLLPYDHVDVGLLLWYELEAEVAFHSVVVDAEPAYLDKPLGQYV